MQEDSVESCTGHLTTRSLWVQSIIDSFFIFKFASKMWRKRLLQIRFWKNKTIFQVLPLFLSFVSCCFWKKVRKASAESMLRTKYFRLLTLTFLFNILSNMPAIYMVRITDRQLYKTQTNDFFSGNRSLERTSNYLFERTPRIQQNFISCGTYTWIS